MQARRVAPRGWGGTWRALLIVLSLLARLTGCEGDVDLDVRVERVGALSFVVALNMTRAGAVDVVATRLSDYPSWGSGASPPTLAQVRAASADGGAIPDAPAAAPPHYRKTVQMPVAGRQTRLLVKGAYNLQRPERSASYGEFVVWPDTTYVIVAAPLDDPSGASQPSDASVAVAVAATADAVSSDASLAQLGVVEADAFEPTFEPGPSAERVSYDVSVPCDVETVTVYASTSSEAPSAVVVDGRVARSGPARGVVPAGGYTAGPTRVFYGRSAPIRVEITAEDRVTTRAYELRVTRARSTEARLANLVLRSGALEPAFSPDVYEYAAEAPHDVDAARVIPALMDARAQAIRVNTVLVESGTPSREIPLRVGTTMIAVEVTAHDPAASRRRTYRVAVTRAYPSADAELGALVVTSVHTRVTGRAMGLEVMGTTRTTHALTPPFEAPASENATATATAHSAEISYHVRRVVVRAAARDRHASLTVTAETVDVPGGEAGAELALTRQSDGETLPAPWFSPVSEIALEVPVGRSVVELTVAAQDRRRSRTTRLTLIRHAPGDDATLANLVVHVAPGRRIPPMTPAFDPATLAYEVDVAFDDEGVYVVPTVENPDYRKIRVNTVITTSSTPSRTFAVDPGGELKMSIAVTAQNGVDVLTYVVTVRRAAPKTEARLADLRVSAGALVPAFSPDVFEYALGPLHHETDRVQVTPYAMDPAHESLTVNGRRQPSGTTSREIFVGAGYGNGAEYTLGNGTVAVTCWAEDRVTARTYRVALTREPAPIAPTDATLRELRVAPTRTARLTPSFAPGTSAYELFVPAREPSVTVTPIANDAHAYRVAVNGVDVGSGGAATTSMSVLLAREDVTLRVEVYARSCDPNWEGFGPTLCARRAYLVELLEYGPGAYEGLLRLRAGDQEDPTGIVREMRPFPSPFRGDADGFVESMEQREAAEYDLGVRSTGAEGVCDNWLCADSEVDATLVAMQIRVEGTAPRLAGDPPTPAEATAGAAVPYAPTFANVTRFYAVEVNSTVVDRIALNVTAASDRVSSIAVNGAEVASGEWSAPVPLHFGTTSISVVVVAGRYDVENVYTVHAFRPAASNPNLESLDVVDETYHKHAAPNLTGVPRPVPPCELHDAAARAAVGLAFHPACDDPSESAAAENNALAAVPAYEPATDPSTDPSTPTPPPPAPDASGERMVHPCDGASAWSEDVAAACWDAATTFVGCDSGDARDVAGFDHDWTEYVVNLDHRTSRVFLNATAADPNAERIAIGATAGVRNCRASPLSGGCAGRDVSPWGWTGGDFGIVAVESARVSPPVHTPPGTTVATATVTAQDSLTKKTYALRAVRPSPDASPRIAGVGPFLDERIFEAVGNYSEVNFTLRFAGMNPTWIVDGEFRRALENHAREYVRYAAVADAFVRTEARASPRPMGASCPRVVDPRAFTSGDEGGVDVHVSAIFTDANATARLKEWVNGRGWSEAPGFEFDGYLAAFGPTTKIAEPEERRVRSGFTPWRRRYAVTVPRGVTHVPIVVPRLDLSVEGYAVTVNGEAYAVGSAYAYAIPPCDAGPRHCDVRDVTLIIEACVFDDCAEYVLTITVPPEPILANDATLRGLTLTAGPPDVSPETRRVVPYAPRFYHDVRNFRAVGSVDRDEAFVHVSARPNSPRYSGLFVNGRAAEPNVPVHVSTTELETESDGVVVVRVIAEDAVSFTDTLVRVSVQSRSPEGLRREAENSLDPLKGLYGFDGGMLPEASPAEAPGWKPSYPRLEPVWEGGPHLEVAAQTFTPATVYWVIAVPWARAPTSREVMEAVLRPANTTTRLVVDSGGGSVASHIAETNRSNPAPVEHGFVAAGIIRGGYAATRETRAQARCLDPTVAFDAWFVAEDSPRDVSARASSRASPPVSVPVAARGVFPGSGPAGLLRPWRDAIRSVDVASGGYNREVWREVVNGAAVSVDGVPTLVFDAASGNATQTATTTSTTAECDAAVDFEVRALLAPPFAAATATSGSVVLEARREMEGSEPGAWTTLWEGSSDELRASGGWVSAGGETPSGEGRVLRWRWTGDCCYSWGVRHVETRYVTP